ncbi:TetR/AcrR family transcriptional regulator [Nocardioides cheoyonin]|uniref:TetR/AcrR family transcriptional regulator n=1 Tax=Nocardioides cheoyonin TaxID=3156615 RepID=UPI0032B5C23B
MPDRRTALADAAVTLVAERGLKGLTHRAVDAAAGVPLGTTSNYWRTREALIDAVVARFEQRDLAQLSAGGGEAPTTPEAVASTVAAALATFVTEQGELTRARFALALARPDAVAAAHRRLLGFVEGILTATGVAEPAIRARRLADYGDGFMLHALTTRRGEPVDIEEAAAAIRALLTG